MRPMGATIGWFDPVGVALVTRCWDGDCDCVIHVAMVADARAVRPYRDGNGMA
ncbi:MAG: hypothetical protein MR448_01000 [Parabacteroides sp.]|nr:hypothetical protein [Parabacteroides sp.]